jgi:hypothetical protein
LPKVDDYDPLGLDSVPKTSFYPAVLSPEETAQFKNGHTIKKKMPIGPFNLKEIDEIN